MKEDKIAFNMQDISIDQFAIIGDKIPVDGRIKTELQIGADKTNKGVAIRFRVTYVDDSGEVVLIIQTTCIFAVRSEDWDSHTSEDGSVSLPHGFLAHLAMHAFGTMRGVLYCKTVETPIGAVILPPTNVDELVPKEFIV